MNTLSRRGFFLQLLIVFSIPLLYAPQASSQSCDSVRAVFSAAPGCLDVEVANRNGQKKEIRTITLSLASSGLEWVDRLRVPDPWTARLVTPSVLEIDASSKPLRAGEKVTLTTLCLNMLCQQPSNVELQWEVQHVGGGNCNGTEIIACTPLIRLDSISGRPSGSYCYDFRLWNRNSIAFPLSGLQVQVLTQAVTIVGTAPSDWTVKNNNPQTVSFATTTDLIVHNDSRRGFSVCPLAFPDTLKQMRFLWKSLSDGRIITIDTISMVVVDDVRCDSVHVVSAAAQVDECCWELDLFNMHKPATGITSLELSLPDFDTRFQLGASGPWPVSATETKRIAFDGSGAPLIPGALLRGFSFCIANNSPSDSVRLEWSTYLDGSFICSEIVYLPCASLVKPRCDTLLRSRVGRSEYNIGFANIHRPPGTINGFRVSVLSGGHTIASATPPKDWRIVNSGQKTATFDTPSLAVLPGKKLDGFIIRFDPPQKRDSVLLQWCVLQDGRQGCCDTVRLPIAPAVQSCDSLRIERNGIDGCEYNLSVTNTHQPATPVQRIVLRMQSPWGGFSAGPAAPAGWKFEQNTPSAIELRSTGTGLLPGESMPEGLALTITSDGSDTLVTMEWCTEDADGTICCAAKTLACVVPQVCDSLSVRAQSDCSFDMRVTNRHTPGAPLRSFTVISRTPGASLVPLSELSSWRPILSVNADTLTYLALGPPVPSGEDTPWLRVGFTLADPGDSIFMNWVSADTAGWNCEQPGRVLSCVPAGCDSIDVLADPVSPCCFSFVVRNMAGGELDGFRLEILDQGVVYYESTVLSPAGWEFSGDSTTLNWAGLSNSIPPGQALGGFTVCFDNDGRGNDDFRFAWQTGAANNFRCSDTVRIACDRTLGIERIGSATPAVFALSQNYPNPCSDRTSVNIDVPRQEQIRIDIVDAAGRLRIRVLDAHLDAGTHAVSFDMSSLPPGAYFCRLHTASFTTARLVTVLR